jgi:hypothetical protein
VAHPRAELIDFLLQHLEDVRAGVRDQGEAGEHIPLMCACWNHPSYQKLEALLVRLRHEQPRLARHLLENYFAPRRRVLACGGCGRMWDAWATVSFHRHGRKSIAVVPRVVRRTSPELRSELVSAGIMWLEREWQGEVYLPDELLGLASAA